VAQPQAPADPRNYRWVVWNDFRPGIISQAKFAYGANDNVAPVPYGGQSAAAQAGGTYGCIALPNGGLGPMPGAQPGITGPSAAFQAGVRNWITGAIVYGPVSGTTGGAAGDELVYCVDSVSTSSDRLQAICATQTGGLWNRVIQSFGPSAATASVGQVYGFTATLTMTNPADSTGVATGTAGVAMTTAFLNDAAAIGADGYLGIYPDPSNPGGTATPHNYSADLPGQPDGETGVVFGHQGRIVIFQQNVYLWTPGSALGAPFDQIYYTDPANTVPGNGNIFSLAQDEVFVQEWPLGAGCWGSMSAGELFVVKHRGGGYIVSGDLDNPTVTFLPGVTPCFGNTIAGESPIGLAYLSGNSGCWVWNGSNVATKISNQLNDDFFAIEDVPPSIGPTSQAFAWGDLIVTSNNYVYDTVTGGWWKLDNQATPFVWFGMSYDASTLYAFPSNVLDSTDPVAYPFSKTQPASTYQWLSYPLETSVFRSLVVREVVVRAQGVGTIVVTLNGIGGTSDDTVPVAENIDSPDQPVYVRFATGIDAQDITVSLLADGNSGGPAPIIYGVAIATIETLPASPT
jgi:hypothetical protein